MLCQGFKHLYVLAIAGSFSKAQVGFPVMSGSFAMGELGFSGSVHVSGGENQIRGLVENDVSGPTEKATEGHHFQVNRMDGSSKPPSVGRVPENDGSSSNVLGDPNKFPQVLFSCLLF